MKNSGLDVRKPEFGGRQAPPSGLDTPSPPTEPTFNKMINPDVTRMISLSEYLSATSGHGSYPREKKPWFIVNGEVYDGAGYLDEHPGGADSIWLAAGERDSSGDFLAIHS
jgi:nitrate reductase (NAD(P)H)